MAGAFRVAFCHGTPEQPDPPDGGARPLKFHFGVEVRGFDNPYLCTPLINTRHIGAIDHEQD